MRERKKKKGKGKINMLLPEKYSPSLPVILATEPSGARLPYNICMWPVSLMGFDKGLIICCNQT